VSGTLGICVNHRCSRFEYVVPAFDGDTCEDCGQLLCHESGLAWGDARKAGYKSAFRVTVLPDAEPPKDRSQRTHFHHAEVGKPGEVGGSHPPPDYGGRSRAAKKAWRTRRKK
jgi:hypothetical protein